jgi:hypothetical protein
MRLRPLLKAGATGWETGLKCGNSHVAHRTYHLLAHLNPQTQRSEETDKDHRSLSHPNSICSRVELSGFGIISHAVQGGVDKSYQQPL